MNQPHYDRMGEYRPMLVWEKLGVGTYLSHSTKYIARRHFKGQYATDVQKAKAFITRGIGRDWPVVNPPSAMYIVGLAKAWKLPFEIAACLFDMHNGDSMNKVMSFLDEELSEFLSDPTGAPDDLIFQETPTNPSSGL